MHVNQIFAGLEVGRSVQVGRIHLVSVLRQTSDGTDADLLDESISLGVTRVTEAHEGGDVNRVRVTHEGKRPLLLLDGEQILGAKQNRIFNASFLVAPGMRVDVPVSCVERQRWHYSAPEFRQSDTTLTARARAAKLSRVTMSMSNGRGYDADQSAVWSDVDDYLERSQVFSSTSAFSDGYGKHKEAVEERLRHVEPEPGQVGVAIVAADRLLSLDVFGSASLYRRAWKKVLRGALGDLYGETESAGDPRALVSRSLKALSHLPAEQAPRVGAGDTIHGAGHGLVYHAVRSGETVYHAIAAAQAR